MSATASGAAGGSIIFQWLERIGLGYSIPQFQAYGINSPHALMQLSIQDYDAVGVTQLHDRRRLWELVDRVNKAAKRGAGGEPKEPKPTAEPPAASSTPQESLSEPVAAPSAAEPEPTKEPERAAPAAPAPSKRDAVAELFRSADIGDETLVQKFTDKLMARNEAEVNSFLANPQKLLHYFSKIIQSDNRRAVPRTEPRRPRTAGSSGEPAVDTRKHRREAPSTEMRKPPRTAYSIREDEEYQKPRRSSKRNNKWEVPAGGGSAPDRNKELGMERERRLERLAAKAPATQRRKSSGKEEEDDGPKITVCVRKRPLSRREIKRKESDVLVPVSRHTIKVHEPKMKVDLTKFTETHEFHFDEVFNNDVTTSDIYRLTAKPLIAGVFRGRNATCFAYGQTGSGKTFTMMGTSELNRAGHRKNPGIYVLAAEDLFKHLAKPEHDHLDIRVSFYEIYGGKLFDLLNSRKQLRALADHNQAVNIMGLSDRKVSTVTELLKAIDYGNSVRSTGSTGANMDSSRSHAVLQIGIHHHKSGSRLSKFSFVDLAGSERGADTTHNDRQTRMEGAEINKSLLALKECIRALYQEHDHTPFRGSKLTQVLKDSFLGNSRTVMIATVSPNITNCEHTLNTLRYAYRVKEIRRADGADGIAYEPPHGAAGDDARARQLKQQAQNIRNREVNARRQAAAHAPAGDSSDDSEDVATAAPVRPVSRVARTGTSSGTIPDHSDIEVDSLGDSSDDEESSKLPEVAPVVAVDLPSAGPTPPNKTEQALIKVHKDQIEQMMKIVQAEMRLVSDRDGAVASQEEYVDKVEALLSEKLALIMSLKKQLSRFRDRQMPV